MQGHLLALALRNAYWAMHRRTNAVLAPYGVTADQYVLLKHLAGSKTLTQQELARRASSDANTVRAMLVLLQKVGLVARKAHPSDKRSKIIVLTPKGQAQLRKITGATEACRREMIQSVRGENVKRLTNTLDALASVLAMRPAV